MSCGCDENCGAMSCCDGTEVVGVFAAADGSPSSCSWDWTAYRC